MTDKQKLLHAPLGGSWRNFSILLCFCSVDFSNSGRGRWIILMVDSYKTEPSHDSQNIQVKNLPQPCHILIAWEQTGTFYTVI